MITVRGRGTMMTVREFTNRLWASQSIIIIRWKEFDKCNNLDDIRKRALVKNEAIQLRADTETYNNVNNMFVDSYGVMDGYLIIEVH